MKTAKILILRHHLAVLQRQQPRRLRLNWAHRALLATRFSVIPKALCVPTTSSTSCDRVIYVDQAIDVGLSSDAVQVEVGRLG